MKRCIFVLLICFINFVSAEKIGSFKLNDSGILLEPGETLSSLNLIPDEVGKYTYDNLRQPVSWEIYVPKNYDPKYPPGALIFINAEDNGSIPEELKPVMDKYNLIWISANKIGAEYDDNWRAATSIYGLTKIKGMYSVNDERVYISGNSKISGWMSIHRADLFKGAIQIDEVPFWMSRTTSENIRLASKYHFVFISGKQNENIHTTKETYRLYKLNKFKNVKMMIHPGEVKGIPKSLTMDEAIKYVDSEAVEKAKDILRKADWAEKYKQYGKALSLYKEIASSNSFALEKIKTIEEELKKYTEIALNAEVSKDFVKAYEVYSALNKKYGSEAKVAAAKLKSFKQDKNFLNELNAMIYFNKIEAATKRKVEKKKILDALGKLIEKYPGTEGAKKATKLLLNY